MKIRRNNVERNAVDVIPIDLWTGLFFHACFANCRLPFIVIQQASILDQG